MKILFADYGSGDVSCRFSSSKRQGVGLSLLLYCRWPWHQTVTEHCQMWQTALEIQGEAVKRLKVLLF